MSDIDLETRLKNSERIIEELKLQKKSLQAELESADKRIAELEDVYQKDETLISNNFEKSIINSSRFELIIDAFKECLSSHERILTLLINKGENQNE